MLPPARAGDVSAGCEVGTRSFLVSPSHAESLHAALLLIAQAAAGNQMFTGRFAFRSSSDGSGCTGATAGTPPRKLL